MNKVLLVQWRSATILVMKFSTSLELLKQEKTFPCALLRPITWNDWFKYSTKYDLFVWDKERILHSLGVVKIGHDDMSPPEPGAGYTRTPLPKTVFGSLGSKFYSLGQDDNYYETLNALPSDIKIDVLTGLRDLAYTPSILDTLSNSDLLHDSILREFSESAVRGRLYLLAHDRNALTPYRFRYDSGSLRGFAPYALDFDVTPRSLPPSNVHVLIGRNGVGKTNCLHNIALCLLSPEQTPGKIEQLDGKRASMFKQVILISFSAFDPFVPIDESEEDDDDEHHNRQSRPARPRYYYIGLKSSLPKEAGAKETDAKETDAKETDAKETDAKETDAKETDAKEIDAKEIDAKEIDAKEIDAKEIDAKEIDAKEIDSPEQGRVSIESEEIVNSFKVAVKKCSVGYRRNRWKAALESLRSDPIFSRSEIFDLLSRRPTSDVSVDGMSANDISDEAARVFAKLSSGHKLVLLIVTRLIALATERTLVLLDEPEAHLHPPLTASLIRCLSQVLYDRNGVAVIATHSPVVLQEVSSSCVYKLRRAGKSTTVERPKIETFGGGIGRLTDEVFEHEVTDSGFYKVLEKVAAHSSSYDEAVEALGGKLSGNGKSILRMMKFGEGK